MFAQCTKCDQLFNYLVKTKQGAKKPQKSNLTKHLSVCLPSSDMKCGCGLTLDQLKSAIEDSTEIDRTQKAIGHMKYCAEHRDRFETRLAQLVEWRKRNVDFKNGNGYHLPPFGNIGIHYVLGQWLYSVITGKKPVRDDQLQRLQKEGVPIENMRIGFVTRPYRLND